MIGGSYNSSTNFFHTRVEGRDHPMSAMTITHGAGDGLPAVGDYISEDFLQVLEVIFSLKNTVITIK